MLLSLLDMKALSPSHDETRTSASNGTEEEEEEERGYLRDCQSVRRWGV